MGGRSTTPANQVVDDFSYPSDSSGSGTPTSTSTSGGGTPDDVVGAVDDIGDLFN